MMRALVVWALRSAAVVICLPSGCGESL